MADYSRLPSVSDELEVFVDNGLVNLEFYNAESPQEPFYVFRCVPDVALKMGARLVSASGMADDDFIDEEPTKPETVWDLLCQSRNL